MGGWGLFFPRLRTHLVGDCFTFAARQVFVDDLMMRVRLLSPRDMRIVRSPVVTMYCVRGWPAACPML
jgi:hypothetical protein